MPSGYAGEGRTYSKKLGRWLKKENEKAFDYNVENEDSVALMISFFRWYPDYFADLFRDENAKYKLELPQRIMMRIFARYRNTYITGVRGLTKTYISILGGMIEGILFPGHIVRYCAPNQKQAAALATKAFHEIEKSYPIIAQMWSIRNDRSDMFRITTQFGSEITMYAPRGDTASACIGEECGQEGEYAFPIDEFVKDIYPIIRDNRMVNQKIDTIHINQKHQHIGNACTRQNRAFSELRHNCLKDMLYDKDEFEGYVLDISWISALISGLRDIKYFKDLKKSLSPENWLRECCARYTGTSENPLIQDETLSKSKKLLVMEDTHCQDPKVIYIVSHDVSYADGAKNAQCADVVLKLTPFTNIQKRDKYKKQAVYVDSYPPPKTAYLQAQKLKDLWKRYCMDNGETTYLVVDAHAYGTEIVEELMKPTNDGTPPLCCVKHMRFAEIEQPHALPVIYPLKAGTKGTTDEDGEMIRYAQVEFDQGNVELLTASAIDGIEAYKNYHNIKDNYADHRISLPYKATERLCQQIQNLKTKVSGLTLKEIRKSMQIQRDIWSALKYALRMAQILENDQKREKYGAESSWGRLFIISCKAFKYLSQDPQIHRKMTLAAS